jgi:hypothetical protein
MMPASAAAPRAIQSVRPKAKPARARLAIIMPFQSASTLSSVIGQMRCERTAYSRSRTERSHCRHESASMSMVWQDSVKRSTRAATQAAPGKIVPQCLKARLVVMTVGRC